MKFKRIILLVMIFISTGNFISNAQNIVPKGKAKLIEFSNTNAKFTVPEGKTWIIYNVFSDYVADEGSSRIRIFLKELNGVEKTNYLKNIYGPQLYFTKLTFPYPIIFPEKTTFSFVILKGDLKNLQLYDGFGYMSLIEIDN